MKNRNYTKEDIILMKRSIYTLNYNIDFDCLNEQRNTFSVLELLYPDIKIQTNSDVWYEYNHRGIQTIQKNFQQFDRRDIEIWTPNYIKNLNNEISKYERKYGRVSLELSSQFNDFINNRNNVINQKQLLAKGTQTLGLSQLISTITSVLEIASSLAKKEIPYLDEAIMGLKGIEFAIKQRDGTITDGNKVGAGLDLMFYVARKSVCDDNTKKALGTASGFIGLCLEFFIGKSEVWEE